MMSSLFRRSSVLAALAVGLAMASPAKAVLVTYSTTGVFGSSGNTTPGTNVFTSGDGLTITYDNVVNATVDTPSIAHFGVFVIAGGTTSTLSDSFTLTINQTVPTPTGSVVFPATLTGTLTVDQSQAYIQFTSPLSQTVFSTPPVTYIITNADGGTPGRLNLPNSASGDPATAAINGQVNSIPEPATMIMALTALPALGLVRKLRKREATA